MAAKNPYFFEVEMGEKVSAYPVDKLKFADGKKELITILSPRPLVTKTHFHEDLGYFYLSDTACKAGLKISVKYNFLAVRWNTDAKGKLISTDDWEIVILSIGAKVYESIATKFEMNGALAKLSILCTCDNAQYQNITTDVAGASPITKDKELAARIQAEYKRLKPFVPQVIATPLEESKVQEVLGSLDSEEYKKISDRQHQLSGGDGEETLLLSDGSDDFEDEEEQIKAKQKAAAAKKKASKKAAPKVVEEEPEDADFEEEDADDLELDDDDEEEEPAPVKASKKTASKKTAKKKPAPEPEPEEDDEDADTDDDDEEEEEPAPKKATKKTASKKASAKKKPAPEPDDEADDDDDFSFDDDDDFA